jgi:hypothetical protein
MSKVGETPILCRVFVNYALLGVCIALHPLTTDQFFPLRPPPSSNSQRTKYGGEGSAFFVHRAL